MQGSIEIRKVDNRALILGVDKLYREAMMQFEEERLLPASQKIVKTLGIQPSVVPIEGYYAQSPELIEYFLNMRALQQVHASAGAKIASYSEFKMLHKVAGSPIYGQKSDEGKLFPAMRDPLYFALQNTPVEAWNAETLTVEAYRSVKNSGDCSLVGLACFIRDTILMTAFRESTVLYAGVFAAGCAFRRKIVYEWHVDREVEERVNRFIALFNELTSNRIRKAAPKNAEYFYHASEGNDILGRCVRIGDDDR